MFCLSLRLHILQLKSFRVLAVFIKKMIRVFTVFTIITVFLRAYSSNIWSFVDGGGFFLTLLKRNEKLNLELLSGRFCLADKMSIFPEHPGAEGTDQPRRHQAGTCSLNELARRGAHVKGAVFPTYTEQADEQKQQEV